MERIAVILTCFNRRDKTLACLKYLYNAYEFHKNEFSITVYLTDDGCTDNTSEAVQREFPEKDICILRGTGSLYWAGGMCNSWKEALQIGYDAYLLLNDDVNVSKNLFIELLQAHEYSLEKFSCAGIYIGATTGAKSGKITYSGWKLSSRIFYSYVRLIPNNKYRKTDFGNANIMLVSKDVVDKIGIFYKNYAHGMADFDYTLTANKNNLPVLLLPYVIGNCDENETSKYELFARLSFVNRCRYLFNPVGLGFLDQIIYMKRHFPWRLPIVFIGGIIKVISPLFYNSINNYKYFKIS